MEYGEQFLEDAPYVVQEGEGVMTPRPMKIRDQGDGGEAGGKREEDGPGRLYLPVDGDVGGRRGGRIIN